MAFLIGIDEAGYGPLLGPLVVSAAVLRLPESLLKADLWETLGRAVGKQKKTLRGRLLIADSKKAYTRKTGTKHLKRTVLATLLAGRNSADLPETTGAFLHTLCPDCAPRLESYPWYSDLSGQPLEIEPDISIASGLLGRVLQENEMEIDSVQSRCLDVRYYNQRVSVVKNKSRVLFTELCTLVYNVWKEHAGAAEPIHFLIDQQGGRLNYRPELQRMFPGMELAVVKNDKNIHSYELTSGEGTMRLHFAAGADGKYLPVSLASMTSKLIREMLMSHLNDYYSTLCQTVKPTAGYWQDGKRYIAELSSQLPESALPKDLLVRVR